MSERKPRAGLLLLAAEWFWKQNIGDGGGRYATVPRTVDADARAIVDSLAPHLDLVSTGLINSREQASMAARKLRAGNLDLLIVCSVIWSEDAPLLKVLEELAEVPLLVWGYVPGQRLPDQVSMPELFRRSGPVGLVQHSGMLKRLNRRFEFVCGPPGKTVVGKIDAYARAARLARELKEVTVGLLPYRCEEMTATYVDEFRLLNELGPKVRYVSVAEYASMVDAVPPSRTADFVAGLRQKYVVDGVGDESLSRTARASLALSDLAETLGLDAVAISDLVPELHRTVKVRPFLSVPEFFDRGRVLGMEGDLASTVGMLICRRLAGTPPMYTEIFTFDQDRNAVLAGHAGMHDVRLADSPSGIRIIPDYEYCEANELEGAWMEFRVRPGRVTLASFFCDVDRFKIVVAKGESMAEGPRLEGFAHALVRLDAPVADFFKTIVYSGMTQHWVITHQDLQRELESLSEILNLKWELIA